MMNSNDNPWKHRFERERQARKEAERLLEDKSFEIWEINQGLETTIKERTKALEEALQKAEDANKAKGSFLSNMSHELRTPLNAIIGFSQILMAKKETPIEMKSYVEKIQISGRNLLELVNTILDFSKIESGKLDFNPGAIVVDDLFTEIEILISPMALQKGIVLKMPKQCNEKIHVDTQLIKQLLLNLLSNAIKFSPVNETVSLEYKHELSNVLFSVKDSGHGIEAKDIETLFDPFEQVRNHQKEDIKGTGLGLAISKHIALMHEGKLWVESEVGRGSCFYLSLPQEKIVGGIK